MTGQRLAPQYGSINEENGIIYQMEPLKQPTPRPESNPAPVEHVPVETASVTSAAPAATVSIPQPHPSQALTPDPVAQPATPSAPAKNDNPSIAADVDVIEKEWVDLAQAVVEKYADDPRAEENAVENLQIDYLKKRYGKDIKKEGS